LGLWSVCQADDVNPIISPNTNSVLNDPMRGEPVHWEAAHTFNPAAVFMDGKVCLLYRAEDNTGANAIGAHTSQLGLAISDDGLHFRRFPQPVFYPANDSQKANEWTGGCEDPQMIESANGTFVLNYARLQTVGPTFDGGKNQRQVLDVLGRRHGYLRLLR
jgi:predicted GH43/DUF377 family glycosyl hydrolase